MYRSYSVEELLQILVIVVIQISIYWDVVVVFVVVVVVVESRIFAPLVESRLSARVEESKDKSHSLSRIYIATVNIHITLSHT